MDAKEKVLATMKEAGEPLNAGKIAELSGLDRKEVDKAMKQLKEEGAIVSPVRCKWAPAEYLVQIEKTKTDGNPEAKGLPSVFLQFIGLQFTVYCLQRVSLTAKLLMGSISFSRFVKGISGRF